MASNVIPFPLRAANENDNDGPTDHDPAISADTLLVLAVIRAMTARQRKQIVARVAEFHRVFQSPASEAALDFAGVIAQMAA